MSEEALNKENEGQETQQTEQKPDLTPQLEELKRQLGERDRKIEELQSQLNQLMGIIQNQALQAQAPPQKEEENEEELFSFSDDLMTEEEKKMARMVMSVQKQMQALQKQIQELTKIKDVVPHLQTTAMEVSADKYISAIREKTYQQLQQKFGGSIPNAIKQDIEGALMAAKEFYKTGTIKQNIDDVVKTLTEGAIDRWEEYKKEVQEWMQKQTQETPPISSGQTGTQIPEFTLKKKGSMANAILNMLRSKSEK